MPTPLSKLMYVVVVDAADSFFCYSCPLLALSYVSRSLRSVGLDF